MEGFVSDLQARINVVFRLQGRPDFAVEYIVDTGFEGALTLPPAVVAALGLPYFENIKANLANGVDVEAPVFVADIVWEGTELKVAVLAMGNRPLLGTALLAGKRICADFVESGSVSVTTLPHEAEI